MRIYMDKYSLKAIENMHFELDTLKMSVVNSC